MQSKDYIIPKTAYSPEAQNQSDNSSRAHQIDLMHNYLSQIELHESLKRRSEKSAQAQKIAQLIESARADHISFANDNTRKNRLDSLISYLLPGSPGVKQDDSAMWSKLVDREALIGGQLLDTDENENHYYHYHDNHEWFWYAENKYTKSTQTVRYKVETGDVMRSVNGQPFETISETELDTFLDVSKIYAKHVLVKIYARADLV